MAPTVKDTVKHHTVGAAAAVTARGGVRRRPVQARSQARLERILEAATGLVETAGVNGATTRDIAARAGVPVASLYQFFADREAVLDALLERELAALDAHVAAATASRPALATLDDFVGFGIDVHLAHYRAHPAFVRLWFGGRVSPAVEAAVRARGRRLAHQWHQLLVADGLLPAGTDVVVAELAVEVGDRVFECAFRRLPQGDPTIIEEGKRAITAYLRQSAPG